LKSLNYAGAGRQDREKDLPFATSHRGMLFSLFIAAFFICGLIARAVHKPI